MKTKFTIFSLLGVMLTIMSCSKDDGGKEFCWKCTMTMQTTVPSDPELNSVTTTDLDQCGMTEDAAKQFENAGTSTVTSSSGGYSATIKSTTRCNKK